MKKNQLFRKTPDDFLITKLIAAFGFKSLIDKRYFSRSDLFKLKTVDRIKEIKPLLEQYYIPCKSRTYINDLNEKNIVTILRQCIKPKGFTITSREKYQKGDKFIIYTLSAMDNNNSISVMSNFIDMSTKTTMITFD